MTGDISKDGEAAALSFASLSCDVLKVPHHGSKTSSSDALLTSADPAAAVIQAGKNNTYGHPAGETLDRFSAYDIPVYRNDQSGAIIIHPVKNWLVVTTAKRDCISPMLLKSFER
jgi:competence protein ComEC